MKKFAKREYFLLNFSLTKKFKIEKEKKSRILVYPMTDFFLLMKNRNVTE